MALQGELPFQRWQRRLGLRQFGFLGQYVGAQRRTGFELGAHHDELLVDCVDDVAGGVDLGALRGLLDRGGDHVRRQGEIARLELIALVVRLRLCRLDLPPLAAPNVRGIGDVHRCLEKVENHRGSRKAESLRIEALPGRGLVRIDGGEQRAPLRPQIFFRLAQRRLRGLQTGIGGQRARNKVIHSARVEHRPPIARDVPALLEFLRRAIWTGRRHRASHLCVSRKRHVLGRRDGHEIPTHGTAGECERHGEAGDAGRPAVDKWEQRRGRRHGMR